MSEDRHDPFLDEEPASQARPRGRLEGLVPDVVKRALYMGLGAVFMTEEGIRNAVSDLKLPKDALAAMLASADKARKELYRAVADEVSKVLMSQQLRDEIVKMLTSLSIEVKAEIRLKDARGLTLSGTSVSVKRTSAEGTGDEGG